MRWSLPWQKHSKSHGKDSRKKARDLRIETLEDKVLLSVDTWVGGGSNNHWSNAANWQAGVAPSAGDQLIFQGTALTSTQNDFTAGTSFQSLEFQSNNFSIAGNSFTVTGSITTDSGVSGTAISAPVALSGSVSASVAAGESLSLSGAVSGTGSLTTTASGTLSLAASNSYSGGTTIDAGMVSFASGGLGSSGTITLGGTSTLQWSGSNTQDISSRLALASAAAATLDTESNTVTLATGFGGSSTASLTKAGSGTLILTGSEGYSGGTTISSGTLQVGNPPMQMTGSLGSGPIVDNGALAIDVSGTTTIAGAISGSGALTQSGYMMSGGTVVLTGTNTFSGAVSVGSYCTLQVGSGGTSGTLGSGGVSGSGTLTFDSSSTQTVSNVLSGGLALTQEGTGALVLTGSNSYTGSTTVNSGSTLRLGGSSVLPDGSGAVAVTVNGTLDLDGYSPTLPGLSGSGTVTTSVAGLATLSVGNTNLSSTFGGVIQDGSGQLALTKAGTGTLILTGSNTFSGGTTINSGGTLQLGNPPSQATGSLGSGPIVDNGTLAVEVSGTTTIAGAISGSGALTQSGYMMSGGTLVLTAANSYSGATTVNSYCTLQVGSGGTSGSLGSGGVSGSGTLTFDSSSTQTVANVLSGGLNLTQEGSGALVLSGSNSYTGNTTVNLGSTLRLGGSSVLPDGSGAVAVTVNGTLDLNGYSPTLPGLSGSGTITTSVAGLATLSVGNTNLSCTFGGVIQNGSGQLALTKTGTGTLTITGSNTYSGTTTISSGTLQLGNPPSQMTGSLGSGPVVDNGALNVEVSGTTTIAGAISGSGTLTQSSYMMSSGTLVLTGSNSFSGAVSVGSNCTLQVGSGGTGGTLGSGGVSGSGTVVFDLSSTLTVGSALSSSLALTVEGTGVVVLTGSNTYSGNTVIDSGATLQVGSGGTAGTLGTSGVSGSGTLAFNRSDSPTIANTLSGSLSLAQQGTGILILTAGNSFTGTTTVNSGGTLQVGAGGTAGTLGSGGVSGAGTLVFDRSDSPTVGNALSGSLSLTQAGSGVLLLTSGSNSFSGATTVNSGGTLRLGGAGVLPDAAGDGTVTVNGTLDLNGYSPTLAGLAGSGTVTSSAAGSITLSAGSNNQPSTFSGVIQNGSATLALTKVGSGTLILTGTNTFSRGTMVSSGTLQVGAGGTAGTLGSGGVSGSGTLAFDRSDSPTIGNTLSGSLSLAQEGSGILVLGGTNSFTGAITINVGGTLQVGGNAALPNGAGTAGITVNGTLDLAGYSPSVGSLAGGGTVTSSVAGTATLGVGANNQSTTFSGLVEDGAGSVTLAKTGTGTLTLGGSGLSFSGGTIAQGTLVIENGLTLNGTLTNDATLSFLGSQALAGSGEVTLGNSSDVLWVQGTSQSDPATLTVGPEMTIHGSGSIDGYYSQDNLVNQGTILADAPYLTLAVDLPVVNEGTLASAGTGVLSLENSVVPLVTVSATTATAYEAGCTPGEFTVTRSGDTTDALGVGYSVTGSGVSGTDYSGLPDFDSSTRQGLLVIPAGASQAQVSITPIEEQIYGGSKTVTLALGQSAGYQIGGDGSDTVTIQENDVEPALTLAATTATAYEYGQTPGQFTLTRSGDTAPALTVTYALAAGSGDALSGTDFTGLPNFNASTGQGWITIPAGASQAQITVTPIDEQLQSGSKAVTLTLGEPSGYEVGTPDSDTVTIEENDPIPTATIIATVPTAYESGAVQGQFTVTRTGSTAAAMTVAYTVATGTGEAVPGTDYESVCNMMDWGSVTIPAGATQAQIAITPIDEQIFGGTKAVTLSLTTEMMGGGSAGYQLGDAASDTVTIEENDVAPIATIVATSPTAYESGEVQGQFTVTRTGSTAAAMTVAYTVAAGTGEAVPGTDYTSVCNMMDWGSVTIPAGASQGEITITPIDEQIFGGTKAVTLTLTTEMMGGGGAGYQLGDAASDTVTIEENDVAPVVTITASATTLSESQETPAVFTISAASPVTSALTVYYTVSGTGVPGTDYTGLPNYESMMNGGSVTIAAGSQTAQFTLTPIDEGRFSGSETATVTLATSGMGGMEGNGPAFVIGTPGSASVTIENDDIAPIISIVATTPTAYESGQIPGQFTVTRTGSTAAALTVAYTVATGSGEAVSGTDYTGLPGYEQMMDYGSVTIPAGATQAEITIAPIDEQIFGGTKAVTLSLTTYMMYGGSAGYQLGAESSDTVTIEENDVAPVVTIAATPTTLSESQQTPGVFTISAASPVSTALTVYYTVSGTAVAGTDYTGLPNYESTMNCGSVTIAAGSQTTQFTVTPIDEDRFSGSETATITLSTSGMGGMEGNGPAFVIGTPGSAGVTIENDDVAPVVTIAATPATLSESQQTPAVFTISAASPVTSALTVYYTVSGTGVAGTDYTGLPNYEPMMNGGSVTIAAGSQTAQFTVTPIDEQRFSGSETATVTLATSGMGGMQGNGPAFVIGTPGSAGVTIDNDDVAPVVSITASPTTLSESEQTPGVFTIARTGGTTAALTVYYTVSGSAVAGTDYTGLPNLDSWDNTGSVTIAAASSSTEITITPVDELRASGSETVTLTLATSNPMMEGMGEQPGFEIGTPDSAMMTIENDAILPTVTIAAAPTTLSESQQTPGTVTISTDSTVSSPLTVYYAVSGTATAGGDYTGLPDFDSWDNIGSVTIAAGSSSAEFTITPVDNELTGGSKTVTVTLATSDPMMEGMGGQPGFQIGTPDSATATIADDYTAVPQPPAAAAQSVTATEDRSLAITLTGSDPDAAQTLTYSITTQPADGTLTGLNAATGQVTYQPDAGYLGADSFSFTVTDNGSPPLTSDPATVTVTVEADQPPVVSNSSKSVLENSTLALASADFSGQFSDPIGGDSLQAVQITTLPQRGTLALSGEPVSAGQVIAAAELGDLAYQPAANYSGEDSFQWNGSDGQLYAASPATMSVDVTYVNQAPSFTAGANQAVDENAGRQQVTSWATNISDGPGDKAGQTLSFTVASDNNPGLFAAGPTVDPATGDLSYTPAAGAYGKATLGLILSDNGSTANGGQDSSATAVFSITVEADNPPVVYDSELSMVANHTLALTAADFSGEFSDPNGASLQSIQVTALPQQGTLALAGQAVSAGQVIAAGNLGNLTYQPAAGTTGSDSLQWNAFDGQLDATSSATMTITVTTDEPPVISDSALAMVENCTLGTLGGDLTASFSDPNGDSLQTVQITALPQQGTLALSGEAVSAGEAIAAADLGNLTYQPAAGYLGQDTFQWTASDGYLSSASSATVTITVEVDQPPMLSDSVLPVIENCTLTFTPADFTANFSGTAAGVSLQAVQITTLPQQGTLALSGQAVAAGDVIPAADLGNLTYQPATGYTGSDGFQWNASDGQLYSLASATMTMAVAGAQPPVAWDSSGSMIEDCTWNFTAADFTANFGDPNPGDSLQSIQVAALPEEGTLSLAGQAVTAGQVIGVADLGSLTYQPDTNYTGEDGFQWSAYDGHLYSAQPADWTITVGQVEVLDGSTFVAGMSENASDVPTGSVDLGQVSVGASAEETLTIANLGDSTLTLDASSLVLPPGFSLAGSFPTSIAARGTAPLAVQMDTSAATTFSGTVSFQTSDLGDSPVMFSLSGQVLGPQMQVSAEGLGIGDSGLEAVANGGSVNLGQVALGSDAEVELDIADTGIDPLSIDPNSVQLPAGFSIDAAPDATVYPGGSTILVVEMDTSAVGSYGGTLSFTDSDTTQSTFSLSLQGTVTAPAIRVLDGSTPIANNSSTSDDFGSTLLSSPVTRTFTISNTGSAALTLNPDLLVVPDGFSVVTPFATSVAPGASTTLVIQLDATQAGSYSGDLSFADNDPNNDPFACTVTGTVNSPSPSVEVLSGSTVLVNEAVQSGNAVNFGGTAQGTPVEQTFTVENTGAAALTLDAGSLSLPDGFSVVTPFAGSVAPGASTTLVVQLDGVNSGQYSGDIQFTDNDPANDPFLISVSGTVNSVAPSISVSDGTSTLGDGSGEEFATTLVGTPVCKTFTISNGGNAALTLDPDSLTVPAGFSVTSPFAATLAPGRTTAFTVEMTAAAAGDYAGTVSFTDNDPAEGTFSFAVSGEVQLPPPSMGVWDGTTALANGGTDCFGTTPAGTSISKTFTIRNTGTGTLALNPDTLVLPNGFSLVSGFAATVAPGASTTLSVQLDASTPGYYAGTLRFWDNDPNSGPFSISIDGLAQAAGAAITVSSGWETLDGESSVTVPDAVTGTPSYASFQIVNVGTQTVTLDPNSLTVPAGFSVLLPFDSSLQPGDTTSLMLQLDAAAAGSYSGAVSFSTSASTDPFSFNISGTVGSSVPAIDVHCGSTDLTYPEEDVDFGVTVAGMPAQQTFTVDNNGAAALTLDAASLTLPAGFSLVGSLPTSVSAGGWASFTVQMDASAAGRFSGEAAFNDNDPLSPNIEFEVGGTVLAPAPELQVAVGGTGSLLPVGGTLANGAALSFPNTGVGSPQSQTLTVANAGTATLTLDPGSLVLPAGFSLVGSFPSSVAPGDLTQVTIQLDAAALGSYSGTLSFTDSDGGATPFTLELSGNVVVPAPSLSVLDSPAGPGGTGSLLPVGGTVDFPAAWTGTPASVTLTLENTGTETLTLDASSLSLPAGFSLVTPFAASVAPGGSTSLVVQLDAAAAGSYGGTLSFNDNDPQNSPFTATLSGTVSDPVPALAVLDSSGEAVDNGLGGITFPFTAAGVPVQETISIENTGIGPLSLDPASLTLPDGFSVVTPFAATVAPGGSTSLVLQLDAAAEGNYAGQVTFNDSDPANASFSFSAAGTVIAAAPIAAVTDSAGNALVSTAGQESLGSTPLDVPLSQVFTISNVGSQTLTIDAASLSVPAGFTVTSRPAASVAPGGSTSFTVQMAATALGSYSGTVSFTNNDPFDSPYTFGISGTVSAPAAAIGVAEGGTPLENGWLGAPVGVPPSGGSGTVTFPATSAGTPESETLTISNTGSAALTLDPSSLVLPAGFSLVTPFAAMVAPGGSTSLVLQLDAAAGGSYAGSLSFNTNDPNNAVFQVNLSGTVLLDVSGTSPYVQVSVDGQPLGAGALVAFCPAAPGDAVSVVLGISNLGSAPLTLDPGSLVVPAGFSIVTPFAATVAPGATTTLTVQMNGSATTVTPGTLSFATNDPAAARFCLVLMDPSDGSGGGYPGSGATAADVAAGAAALTQGYTAALAQAISAYQTAAAPIVATVTSTDTGAQNTLNTDDAKAVAKASQSISASGTVLVGQIVADQAQYTVTTTALSQTLQGQTTSESAGYTATTNANAATQQNSDQSVTNTLDGAENTDDNNLTDDDNEDVSSFDSTAQGDETSAQNTQNADAQTAQTADTAAQNTYQGVQNSDQQTYNTAQTAAQAVLDAALAGYSGSFDPSTLGSNSAFQASLAPATAALNSAVDSLMATYNQALTTAGDTYNQSAQTALDAYNTAIQQHQATHDQAIAADAATALAADQAAQATYNQAVQAHQQTFNNAQQTADDQYTADMTAADNQLQSSLASADDDYYGNVQTAQDDYNAYVQGRSAQLASDQNTARTAYQSAVATENATYASKMAGYTNTMNVAIQAAVAAYDQTVAGLQSTLSAGLYAENGDWLAVTGPAKAYDQARAAYLAGQGSWAAVEDAAEALADTYANVVLQVDGTNEGLYDSYVQGEEKEFVTEQKAIAQANLDFANNAATAAQTRNDKIADALETYNVTLDNLQEAYNNDIATHEEQLATKINGYIQVCDDAYATAYQVYDDASAAADADYDDAIVTAEDTQTEADAASAQTLADAQDDAAAVQEDADAAADQAQADADAASATTYDDALAAAGTVYANAADAAGAALMDNTVQAEEQYIDQYAQDMVNSAGSGDAAAAAYAAYYTTLGSDWAAQATGDVSAWKTDGQQLATAAQNQIQADASAVQGLVDQVVSAEVGLVSQVASAVDSTAKQIEAAAVAAVDGWSGDAKTDALSDINAAVPVCQQLDQDDLNCEEGCISAGLTDADDQWSQWLPTVEVDDGDAAQCGNTVAGNLDQGQHTVDQAAKTAATGLAQQSYNLAVGLAQAHQTWYVNNIQWQMSTMVQIAQANASRVSSTDPPLNGTSAVALMKSDGVCAWASLMPFLNSAGLCLYPSMSGTTLLSAAESAKGVTFAGHYWGPGQYSSPVSPAAPTSNAMLMALLSQAAYGEYSAPDGWQAVGLPDGIKDGSGCATLFYNPTTQKYVLAFRGTEPFNRTDWNTNLRQGVGMTSNYYEGAIKLALALKTALGGNLELTGHSLGGGMASAAALVTGLTATVFNPAGVNPDTVAPWDVTPEQMQNATNITAFCVGGVFFHDILTNTQDNSLGLMPQTVGNVIMVTPTYSNLLEGAALALNTMFGISQISDGFLHPIGAVIGGLSYDGY